MMCGIAGWINLKEDLTHQEGVMKAMTERLANRGPDAMGFWSSTHAQIGHRRLVVVDPAGGVQPMVRKWNGKTFVITYNGELYNTADLRSELSGKGYIFESNSDTEVLLISYIEWGTECVSHLNGIYAFGVWNQTDQQLFLARDRFGVKPLFYALRNNSLIFASELKALLAHPLIQPEIQQDGLAEIFALGPARTPGHGIYKGVNELRPAQCLLHDDKGVKVWAYWKLESRIHTDNLQTTLKKVNFLVQDAIQRQLVADVPVCTFLSGGLDSSTITALAANYFTETGRGPLHTFSIDYVDNDLHFKPSSFQPNSDAPWVERMVAEHNTIHHYIEVDTPQIVDALIDATEARDLPGMADVDSSLWFFCREIKKTHVVSLSGECAY